MTQAYPPSRVPVTPVLSAASLRPGRGPHVAAVTDVAQRCMVTSGRIALALAVREMKLDAGARILVPAYHSMSMIPPLLAAGLEPVFYKLGADAAVDLDDVAGKLHDGVRALIVVNYFGFPQDLAAIRAFCDGHGLLMLEDCAHSFFGAFAGRPLGSFGDYAIASSMKFYPIYEGGCLVSAHHRLDHLRLRSAGVGFELKSALAAVERGVGYGRLALTGALLRLPLTLKSALWSRVKRGATGGAALTPSSSDSSYGFDPAWMDKRSSLFSRTLMRLAPRAAMGARRRRNYQAISARLGGLPGCRLLFGALPADVYPWVVPVVVNDHATLFAALKQAGVPIIRFGETLWQGDDATVCPNSSMLSRQVMGFPCHQELTGPELEWLIRTVETVVAAHEKQR